MTRKLTLTSIVAVFAMLLMVGSANAALVTTTVTASQDKNNFGGELSDLISGEEMTKPDATDPSTWTTTTNNYADGWNQQGLLSGATNNKIAWVVLDLGSVTSIDSAYFWAWRHGSSASNNVADYNLYLASSPTVAPPAATTTITDYDFASGGWTQFGSTLTMPNKGASPAPADQVISFGGSSARYIGMEILTNDGGSWVGFHEVAVTAIPEPASLALIGLGSLLIAGRRRKA